MFAFFGFFCSPVGVGAFDDPKKPTKQTDRRGRRSLQGFVIPPCLLSLVPFLLRRGRRLRRPEKPTKQTDSRGRLSLQGFGDNLLQCFLLFLRRGDHCVKPASPRLPCVRGGAPKGRRGCEQATSLILRKPNPKKAPSERELPTKFSQENLLRSEAECLVG